MGHESNGDVVFGMYLYCNGMGIVVVRFPLVNGFDIGPAPVAMQLGCLGIAWKNKCIVFVLVLDNGCVPLNGLVRFVEVAFGHAELRFECEVKIIGK